MSDDQPISLFKFKKKYYSKR